MRPADTSSLEENLSLTELLRFVFDRKWFFVTAGIVGVLLGFLYLFVATDIYRAEALVRPRDSEGQGSIGSSQAQLLGRVAGLELGGQNSSRKALALEVLQSRAFVSDLRSSSLLEAFLFPEDLDSSGPKLQVGQLEWRDGRPPSALRLHRRYLKQLKIEEDQSTGFITIAFENPDPQTATALVHLSISEINSTLKSLERDEIDQVVSFVLKQIQTEKNTFLIDALSAVLEDSLRKKIMLGVREDFALQVIDPAVAPDLPHSPKPLFVIVASPFLSVVLTFFVMLILYLVRRSSHEG